jgi:hypothetical protein
VARLRDEHSGYHPNELMNAYLADADPRSTETNTSPNIISLVTG